MNALQKVSLPLLLILSGFLAIGHLSAQKSLILKTRRPPELDVSHYKQVAIGDIVGPLGAKTEQSLDLTDALSARLFNGNTVEVIDRNALDKILGDQKFKDLQVIDEKTKQTLNKKLNSALLVTGRIQSEKLEQKLIYQDQGIVVNGCTRTYYYQVKGDVTVQLKILDLKTGKMIFNDAVIKPVDKKTKEDCSVPNKLNVDEISRQAIKDLSEEIAKLIVPYDVSTLLQFSEPGLFKNPFKQLNEAVAYLETNNTEAGLAILKKYTEDKNNKAKVQASAYYNYSLGLIYTGKYAEAKQALEKSVSLNSANLVAYKQLVELMEKEEQAARRMTRLAEEKAKIEQEVTVNPEKRKAEEKPAAKSTGTSKPAAKKTVRVN